MQFVSYYRYIKFDNEDFFTVILLPSNAGKFPTVIMRSPYVHALCNKTETEIVEQYLLTYRKWIERGYAVVVQHCRGQGKSSGAFIPYIHEREDGLALNKWIRGQDFYNGELYLVGASYTASLHYTTAPLESDIKGAVFEVQDSERYRLWYRNGQMRKGHANWHFNLYKPNRSLNKTNSIASFSQLPLKDLSERVLGERAEDFEQMLAAERMENEFWQTRFGGAEAKNATDNANIPILFTTGYNDFYVGGMFRMWGNLNAKTKSMSAMLVSPYNHGDGYDATRGLSFKSGKKAEQFGNTYQIDWFDNIRSGRPLPYQKGVITYYRTFENRWQTDFHSGSTVEVTLPLGNGKKNFKYDPLNPPAFCGEGLIDSGSETREDTITLYTKPFEKDTFIKGQMGAILNVSSNCDDTSFYVRISLKKQQGDYVLRHDITSLCYALGAYRAGDEVEVKFKFDEYAFLIKEGERLRIDISSTDNNSYVCHTNKKGAYYLQDSTEIATNSIDLSHSFLIIPEEK